MENMIKTKKKKYLSLQKQEQKNKKTTQGPNDNLCRLGRSSSSSSKNIPKRAKCPSCHSIVPRRCHRADSP
jgi:hypothetical protein